MTQEELGFYNKQDKEELVIMCIARDNKIEHLRKEIDGLVTVIDLAKHFIKKYETIRGYYEYEECGYDEYNYEDDLKQELLEILERVTEE